MADESTIHDHWFMVGVQVPLLLRDIHIEMRTLGAELLAVFTGVQSPVDSKLDAIQAHVPQVRGAIGATIHPLAAPVAVALHLASQQHRNGASTLPAQLGLGNATERNVFGVQSGPVSLVRLLQGCQALCPDHLL